MHEQIHRAPVHPPRQPQPAAKPRMPVRRPIAPAATPTNVIALDRKGNGACCTSCAHGEPCGNKLGERSSGERLPEEPRARLEQAMGADLSGVRIHRSADSARAAEALGANAYTIGQDVHFGAGKYDPVSASGQRLLAHEVAHTVQQRGAAQTPMTELGVSEPGDPHEIEAERFAGGFAEGRQRKVSGVAAGVVSRAVVQRDKANDGAASSSTGKPATDGSSFKGAATPTDTGATTGDKDEDAVREQMKRRLVAAQSKAGGLQGVLASAPALTITPAESGHVNGLYASLRGVGSGVTAMPALQVPSVPEPVEEPDTEHAEGAENGMPASNDVQPAEEPEAAFAPGVQPTNAVVLAPVAAPAGAAPVAIGVGVMIAIVAAIVALIVAVLVALGVIKRPPIEMYVILLIMQILMAVQQIIDKARPKPRTEPRTVPKGRGAPRWGDAPRRRRELTPRKGLRERPDPKLGPDIEPMDPRKRDPRRPIVTLLLPPQKGVYVSQYRSYVAQHLLQHRIGRPRDTNQRDRWDDEMDPRESGEMTLETWCWGVSLGLSPRDILRPRWSSDRFWPDMHVDHRIEYQVSTIGGEAAFDEPWNYELLDQASNTSSGSQLDANIDTERRDLVKSTGDSSWLIADITFDIVRPQGSGSSSGRWTFEQVRDGHHLSAYERLTGKAREAEKIKACIDSGGR